MKEILSICLWLLTRPAQDPPVALKLLSLIHITSFGLSIICSIPFMRGYIYCVYPGERCGYLAIPLEQHMMNEITLRH